MSYHVSQSRDDIEALKPLWQPEPALKDAWRSLVGQKEDVYALGQLAIVRANRETGVREALKAVWGLLPNRPWVEKLSDGRCCYNARSETLKQKPTFKSAIIKKRCLIPVSAFYEWSSDEGDGEADRHRSKITRTDGGACVLAGLYEKHPTFGPSAAVITAGRQSLVLEPEQFEMWLDPELQDWDVIRQMLFPWNQGELTRVRMK